MRYIQIFNVYLIIINLAGYILIGTDKFKAKRKRWRIKESIFIVVAFAGGSVGILIGMVMFKHKTNKNKFSIGIPILYILNIIVKYLMIYRQII